MATSDATTDRTWSVPNRAWDMRMGWHDLLFCHWPVPVKAVERLLPSGLRLDTFDGQAWIGVVPFRMTGVAPRGIPAIPWLSAFPELNVRTYVSTGGKPGVWFFSLDATNPLAVRIARKVFHLKYMDARISFQNNGGQIHYRSHRTHRGEPAADLEITYRPIGDRFFARTGTLEYWLTARYCLYVANRRGQILRGEIDHPPWPLQNAEATIKRNTMLEWLGLEQPAEQPHLLFARDINVVAWTNEKA